MLQSQYQYLADLDGLNSLTEKALLEVTLYGIPMLNVAPKGAGQSSAQTTPGVFSLPDNSAPTSTVASGPGNTLGLYEADVTVPTGTLTQGSVDQDGTTLTYDSDTSGVVANPGQAVLPVQTEDVAYSANGVNQVLRGVGFLGGSYTDTDPVTGNAVTPLTGDPVTETYEPAAPFASPIFYPETLSNTNYFPTLESGGDTDLGITPEQYITNTTNPGVGTAIKRTYTNTQFALFYSDNFGSAALAAAPSISNVSVTASGSVVTVSATVLGNVSGVQQVWTTWTDPSFTPNAQSSPQWQSELLTQSPLDPTQYTATFDTTDHQSSLAGGDFIVQAANGVGEVSLDDNNGFYFTPGSAPGTVTPSPNTYTLTANASATPDGLSPIDSATYGSTIYLTATLAPNTGTGNGVGDLVTFQIGNQYAYAVTGSGGVASTSLPLDQTPGSYALTANYLGDAEDQPATSSESFTIAPDPTSLELNAPPELISGAAGSAGNSLSATLTTSGRTAIPFQTVVFDLYEGTDVSDPSDLVASTTGETNGNGVADAQPVTVPAGDVGDQFTVVAYYGQSSIPAPSGQTAVDDANPDYGPSTASTTTDVVNPTVGLSISATSLPLVYQEPATLTATVTPPPGLGSVTFSTKFDGTTTSVCTSVQLSSTGTATCPLPSGLPVGTSTLTASYLAQQDSYSTALMVTVGPAPTTTTLTVTPQGKSVYGQTVALSAQVVPSKYGTGPTGTVTFYNGTTVVGTGTLNNSGVATASVASLPVGSPSLTAKYSGNSNFSSSTSSNVVYTVNKAATTTALTASTSSAFGTSVNLSAQVNVTSPGSGTAATAPTGTVTFLDGTLVIATVNLPGNGLATVTVSGFQAGAQSLTATYSGDGNFAGSTTSKAVTDSVTFTKTISWKLQRRPHRRLGTVRPDHGVGIRQHHGQQRRCPRSGQRHGVRERHGHRRCRFHLLRRDAVGGIVGLQEHGLCLDRRRLGHGLYQVDHLGLGHAFREHRRRSGGYQHHQRGGFCRQQLRHRTDPAWGFGDRGDWQHHQRVAVLLDQHPGGDRQRDGQQGVQQERAVRRALTG